MADLNLKDHRTAYKDRSAGLNDEGKKSFYTLQIHNVFADHHTKILSQVCSSFIYNCRIVYTVLYKQIY